MPLLLVALFIVVPLLELYIIIQVGGAIGAGPTVFILLADSVLGALLLRSQGRAAWVRFNRALAETRMPGKEVLDGVLIIFGGALLLTPGFLTDVLGLILLIPPTRAGFRALMRRVVVGRLAMGPRGAVWSHGRVRDRRGPGPGPGRPAPGGSAPGEDEPPPRRPAWGPDEDFGWTTPPSPGPRPDDIEGTAREVDDDDEDALPPGERGVFPG